MVGKKADDKKELELRQSALKDLVWGVSASPLFSLECEAAAAVWGPGRGSDTGGKENKGGKKKRKLRMSVEDKDDIGNDKSGCL